MPLREKNELERGGDGSVSLFECGKLVICRNSPAIPRRTCSEATRPATAGGEDSPREATAEAHGTNAIIKLLVLLVLFEKINKKIHLITHSFPKNSLAYTVKRSFN